MDNILSLIGRTAPLFEFDILMNNDTLCDIIKNSRFLVIGGAGTIGSAICRELFTRNPKVLHVVDISENNMVELVRDIRSSVGYCDGEFATFAIDCGSDIFKAFIDEQVRSIGGYDYIFNTSALKHVRSEKDPYTLMRMIDVNIFNTDITMEMAHAMKAKKYFCVSTDKAANPVNMMGASKRIMEMFLNRRSVKMPVSTARFANVAFSDGSLLYGFNKRIEKKQPIAAPNDVRRYFVTPKEAGELCVMSGLLGENRDILFPKLDHNLDLITFSDIAGRYLENLGYQPVECESEDEARSKVDVLTSQGKYPVYFFKSDTTGEKDFEEFFTEDEELVMDRFESIGIIKNKVDYNGELLDFFVKEISIMRSKENWSRVQLIDLFNKMLPNFNHQETGKFLDAKM